MPEHTRRRTLLLVAAGFAVGMLAAAAIGYGMHATSTDEFCNSCHADNAAQEWRESVHYRNGAGFVAGCADCHLPQALGPKLLRKARGATLEVWAHVTGLIGTPQKYEAHRQAMAEVEWQRLRANGAQECRACHRLDSMADAQRPGLSEMHQAAASSNQICTDCHKGVAHRAP